MNIKIWRQVRGERTALKEGYQNKGSLTGRVDAPGRTKHIWAMYNSRKTGVTYRSYTKCKLHVHGRELLCTFLFLSFFVHGLVHAQVKVSANKTATQLAQKLAGQGVTVLNATMNCAAQANGFFSVVSSNLGLDSGIVLTTGRAASGLGYIGVNGYSVELASNNNGYPGDATLDVLAGQNTVDACKLEFDVIPSGDTISIDYVFSSEEYISAVCGPYNDAFAFFISGPGIAGTDNMALVPGTNIPVTINSINNGIPGSTGNLINCTMIGGGSPFTAFYRDNGNGTSITHKGLTTVLKAIHAVTPCGTYHLKIVIADAGNAIYDSGVFLAAGSLNTGNYTVLALPPPAPAPAAPYCVKGCLPGKFRIRRSKPNSLPQVLHFATTGTAVSGVDYLPLADSVTIAPFDTSTDVLVYGIPTPANGPKTLRMLIYAPAMCSNSMSDLADSASMVIYDTIHIAVLPRDTTICGRDTVLMSVQGDDIYSYSWLPDMNISNINTKQPFVFPDANTTYTVAAVLPGTACPFKTATATLGIKPTPSIFLHSDTLVCYNTSFRLAPAVTPVNSFYSYQWTGPAGFSAAGIDPLLNNVTANSSGLYSLVVKNDTDGCTARAAINVTVIVPDTPQITSPVYFCLNSQPAFFIPGGNKILWYTDPGGASSTSPPDPPTSTIAQFHYYISQVIDECESPKKDVYVQVKQCCDGKIFIPTAFTPNGDGQNDLFRPIPDYGYFLKDMSVYNRWGQIIYSSNFGGWDGNFGATPVPGGAYFYRMIFGCILGGTEERTGDVTLIR